MRRLLLVTLLALAGCTATEPGTPTAGETTAEQGTTTSTATTTTTPTTTRTAKPRPRAVDMTAVDICAVLTQLPRAPFGLDDRAPVGGESGAFPGSQDCFTSGIDNNLGLSLVAVVDQGAAEYVDGANADVAEADVEGFTLYVLTPPDPGSCFGALDVNDGQMLYVNYGVSIAGEQPVTPQATLCERVPQIAVAALDLL